MQHATRRTLRPEDTRRSNLALVLQSVYDKAGLSRADIARATGLTKVTVSTLVAELMDAGLVVESGTSSETKRARPGAPSTLLAFNADARRILAIDLSSRDTLHGLVLALDGRVVQRIDHPLDGATGDTALAAARALAGRLVAASDRPVLGLGVGTPGPVSPSGTVIAAPNLEWSDLPLARILADHLGVPVHVENDANAAVLAERRFGGLPGDLVRVHFSRGVGAGLLVAGQLVRGPSSDAGEIGHVVLDPKGIKCSCGKRGCLETQLSVPALTAAIEADPGRRRVTLAHAGTELGVALAPVVGMLGLNHVVVGGPASIVTDDLLDSAREVIAERTRSEFRPELTLGPSALGDDAVLLGAAALVLLGQLGVV